LQKLIFAPKVIIEMRWGAKCDFFRNFTQETDICRRLHPSSVISVWLIENNAQQSTNR